MDIQQLKSHAGRVRDLLQQSNHPVGHNQALDLVSALIGLRNWPEVLAFPDRVAGCELDLASAGRLAFRLKKLQLELSPESLVSALSAEASPGAATAPQIWPTGPRPGVYVTTSQTAINALLARYEDATDGALVYADRAGSHWEGSIDLGEGLWSSGLSRVPSGTLIVVGPLKLDQQSWEENASHLHTATLHALSYGHRIAVLVDTPTPDLVCEDALLMVKSAQEDGDDGETALLGIVSEEGELQPLRPFARPWPQIAAVRSVATSNAIPSHALAVLANAVAERRSGLLLFGSSVLQEHRAADIVAASLAITEHAGPAARIMPRHRSTPAKDWQVPEALKNLPFLPSMETAYEQGYRRIVFDPYYTNAESLLRFGNEALLIGGAYASKVEDVYVASAMRRGGHGAENHLLAIVIAILAVLRIPGRSGESVLADLFVMQREMLPVPVTRFEDITAFLNENRVLNWQEEMSHLLDSGKVTMTGLKKALPRNHDISDFLSQRTTVRR